MNFTLVIDGKPKGKDRARRAANGGMFTPKATKLAEAAIVEAWRAEGKPRFDGPVSIDITLFVARPQGHFKMNGSLSAAGERKPFPTGKKPDLDNACKLVMDALNGQAYRDDVDVIALSALRVWSDDGWESTRVLVGEVS